jgi:protein-tyrosine phosphatase
MAHLVDHAGLADRIEVDSAGTGGWHVGRGADPRSVAEARRRGVELTGRARQFHPGDFYRYDLVLAMDARNLADLRDLAPEAHLRPRARLLRAFDPALAGADPAGADGGLDVPDPYHGGDAGFRTVFEMVEAACRGLLDHVRTLLR